MPVHPERITSEELAAAAYALRSAKRVTAICHENPDADTVAGALAISRIAGWLGKPCEVVSSDGIPPNLAFLPGASGIRHRPTTKADLVVICDAATAERVGPVLEERERLWEGARILNVDHHRTNTRFGDVNLVDSSAGATCQVVAELVEQLGLAMDPDLATLLLTGIVRDTQGFSDETTSARTLEIAADLRRAGAPLPDIYRHVITQLEPHTIVLWGRLLAGVAEHLGGRVLSAVLTEEDLRATRAQQHEADGVAEFLSRASGADVVLLLREVGPATTRVSVRTLECDAPSIVAPFGGGGHTRRAGCSIEEPIAAALDRVLDSAARVLDTAGGPSSPGSATGS